MTRRYAVRALLALAFLVAREGGAQDASAQTSVTVCVERGDSGVTYHYRAHNAGRGRSRIFVVGLGMYLAVDSSDAPDGGGELTVLPVGTSPDWHVGPPTRPRGATSPPHWYAELQRVEETNGAMLSWYADAVEFGIGPGGALGGFSVTLPRADSAYATGHWTLLLDGEPNAVGRLKGVACAAR